VCWRAAQFVDQEAKGIVETQRFAKINSVETRGKLSCVRTKSFELQFASNVGARHRDFFYSTHVKGGNARTAFFPRR